MSSAERPQKRSIFRLVADLPGLLMDLVREEIEQFKQEMLSKVKAAGIGIGLILAAVFVLLFALMTLIGAAVAGLATVWPVWLSALVVGGALLVIAIIVALVGVASLRRGVPPAPTRTIASVKRDVDTIKGIGRH